MALIKINHMKAKQIGKPRCNLATKIDSSVVNYLIVSKNKMKEMQKKEREVQYKRFMHEAMSGKITQYKYSLISKPSRVRCSMLVF